MAKKPTTDNRINNNIAKKFILPKRIYSRRHGGFTLIELLIEVVLIGILSGVVLGVINVGGIRAKSRDAQRVGDIKKIQTALELYFADNRSYIQSGTIDKVTTALSALPSGKYINKLPDDPTQSAEVSKDPCATAAHSYLYVSQNTVTPGSYVLMARMEVSSSDDASPCSELNNWAALVNCAVPAEVYCYGAENPL